MILLAMPFGQKSATREVRVGLSRAFVAFSRWMARPQLERHAEFLLGHLQTMLAAPGAGQQVSDIVSHAMRAGLGENLSERGQCKIAAALAASATARVATETLVVVALKETAMLLLSLREVATSARDALLQGERSLLVLVEHTSSSVRLAACSCLWSLSLAFPQQLAGLLNSTINRLRQEHARLINSGTAEAVGADGCANLLAHAHTAGALVSAIPHTPFGVPNALTMNTLSAASDLAASPEEHHRQVTAPSLPLRPTLRPTHSPLHRPPRAARIVSLALGFGRQLGCSSEL